MLWANQSRWKACFMSAWSMILPDPCEQAWGGRCCSPTRAGWQSLTPPPPWEMKQVNCCWTLWMTAVSSRKHEEGVKHAILKIGVSKKLFAREKPLRQQFNWIAFIFIHIWKSEISPCQQISRTTGTSQSPRSEYLRMSRNKEQPIS